MAEDRRREKVDALMKQELADLVAHEVAFPKGVLVTITRVLSSHDLYYADVYVSVFPKKEHDAIALLEKKTPFIQSELNKRLRMRPVPRIRFTVDREEKKRERLERILNTISSDGAPLPDERVSE